MNKPDYKHEQSKAKRAADLIEFGDLVIDELRHFATTAQSDKALHGGAGEMSRSLDHERALMIDKLLRRARSLGLLDDAPREEEKP